MVMMIVNPGAGPVEGASLDMAVAEAKMLRGWLADELGDAVVCGRNPDADGGGRFGFTYRCGRRRVEVEIPGVDLDLPQYEMFPPRFYVDGSSWVPGLAGGMVLSHLRGEA